MDGEAISIRPHRFTVSDYHRMADRDVKLPLYAESSIPGCWIMNLADRIVEAHRGPRNGRYAVARRVGPGGALDLAMLAGAEPQAADLFRV